jgi:hypothetical protein
MGLGAGVSPEKVAARPWEALAKVCLENSPFSALKYAKFLAQIC